MRRLPSPSTAAGVALLWHLLMPGLVVASDPVPPAPRAAVDSLLAAGRAGEADSLALAWARAAGSADPEAVEEALDLADRFVRGLHFETGAGILGAVEDRLAAGAVADTLHARLLYDLAKTELNLRRTEEGKEHMERALRLRLRARGERHPEVAACLAFRAIASYQLGRGAEAEADYRRALEIYRETLGPDHPHTVWALNAYASYLQGEARWDEARDAYEEVLRHRDRDDDLDAAWTYNNLGALCMSTGEFGQAERYYARAGDIRGRLLGEDHPFTASSRLGAGNARFFQGDYLPARTTLEGCLAILEGAEERWLPERVAAIQSLALAYYWTGEPERALALYEKGLGQLRRMSRPDPRRECHMLAGIAQCQRARGRIPEAEATYRQVVSLAETTFGNDSPRAALTRIDLAVCLADGGDLDRALDLYRESVAILEASHDAYAFGWSLTDFAYLLLEAGRPQQARDAFLASENALRDVLWETHPRRALIQAGLARSQARLGDLAAAREAAARAVERGRTHLFESLPYLSEWHAMRYREPMAASADLLAALSAPEAGATPADDVLAWEAVVNTRSLILDELMNRGAVRTTEDPEVRRAWSGFENARQRLANLYLRSDDLGDAALERAIRAAVAERESAEREWARATASDRNTSPRYRALRDIARSLPPDAALVSYYRHGPISGEAGGDSAYVAWVLSSGAERPVRIPLGPAGDMESAALAWHRHMMEAADALRLDPEGTMASYGKLGTRLRELCWDPVRPHLEGYREVFVVPEGPLHLVSLACLPSGPGRFLQDGGWVFRYLDSEGDLLRGTGDVAGTGLLAVGDPAFADTPSPVAGNVAPGEQDWLLRALDTGCLRAEAAPLPLPGTRLEVEEITELWRGRGGPAEMLTGVQATEDRVRHDAPGKAVLHLATHGLFPDEDCFRSGAVGPWLEDMGALLRSGVILAVGGGTGDGMLTAEEVAGLDLRGTRLVVLSACGTGLGQVRDGEGVYGLRRGFRAAGVPGMVIALWPLPDRLTRDWMRVFYSRYLSGGSDAGVAVSAASSGILTALRNDDRPPHPVLWGGPVFSGPPRTDDEE